MYSEVFPDSEPPAPLTAAAQTELSRSLAGMAMDMDPALSPSASDPQQVTSPPASGLDQSYILINPKTGSLQSTPPQSNEASLVASTGAIAVS